MVGLVVVLFLLLARTANAGGTPPNDLAVRLAQMPAPELWRFLHLAFPERSDPSALDPVAAAEQRTQLLKRAARAAAERGRLELGDAAKVNVGDPLVVSATDAPARFGRAERLFRRASELRPSNPVYISALVGTLQAQSRHGEASVWARHGAHLLQKDLERRRAARATEGKSKRSTAGVAERLADLERLRAQRLRRPRRALQEPPQPRTAGYSRRNAEICPWTTRVEPIPRRCALSFELGRRRPASVCSPRATSLRARSSPSTRARFGSASLGTQNTPRCWAPASLSTPARSRSLAWAVGSTMHAVRGSGSHALPPRGGSDDAGRSRALGANLCDLYTADAPPRVFMVATRAIKEDEELLTDYGESYWRGREALMGARASRGSPKARSDAGGAAPPRRAAVAGARNVTPADLPGLGVPDLGLPRFDVDALAESFLRVAALTPKPARALSNAAVALARAERADEALHWAARAATLRPDDAGVKQNNDEVVAWANVGHAAPWGASRGAGTASEPGAPSLPRGREAGALPVLRTPAALSSDEGAGQRAVPSRKSPNETKKRGYKAATRAATRAKGRARSVQMLSAILNSSRLFFLACLGRDPPFRSLRPRAFSRTSPPDARRLQPTGQGLSAPSPPCASSHRAWSASTSLTAASILSRSTATSTRDRFPRLAPSAARGGRGTPRPAPA